MKSIRLWFLKKRCTRLLRRRWRVLDRYDCDRDIAEQVCPDLAEINAEIRTVWAKIRKLDPNAPDVQL